MIRTLLSVLTILILSLPFALPLSVDAGQAGLKAYTFLVGSWEGELEYLDYGDDRTLVSLPTHLVCEPSDDGRVLVLKFAYEEPDGSVATDSERLFENSEGLHLGGLWQIEKRSDDTSTGTHRLLLVREGEDNGREAEIRNSVVVEGDTLTITKLVRYRDTSDWFQRHQYRFKRAGRGMIRRARQVALAVSILSVMKPAFGLVQMTPEGSVALIAGRILEEPD